VNKGILSGGKLSTMHITPLQAAFMKDFKRLKSLFCAFIKGNRIDIVNKTHSRSRKVVRTAGFNKVSIVKKEEDRRQR
jgi:hypothetical protein